MNTSFERATCDSTGVSTCFRITRYFWTLILGVLLLVSVTQSASATVVGNDDVNFVSVRYDFPNPGESTWYYEVISGSKPAISHVTFQVNLDPLCAGLMVIDEGTWDSPDQTALNSGLGSPSVGTDATTGLTGVKFDEGFSSGETRHYYFTVNGNYAAGDITVATKAGPGFDTGTVTGPSLDCTAANPVLSHDKSFDSNADEDGSFGVSPGDTLTYKFVAGNAGNVALTNVTIVDPKPGVSALSCVPAQPATLAPGASMTCTATYVVTQADGSSGYIINTSTADSDETDPVEDTEIVAGVLPVTVGYFSARVNGDMVEFAWQTATETANAGFNLLAQTDAGLVQLNDQLIPSQVIDSTEPVGYEFEAATDNRTFFIQDVSIGGAIDQLGPFELGVEYGVYVETDPVVAGESEHLVYLPILISR